MFTDIGGLSFGYDEEFSSNEANSENGYDEEFSSSEANSEKSTNETTGETFLQWYKTLRNITFVTKSPPARHMPGSSPNDYDEETKSEKATEDIESKGEEFMNHVALFESLAQSDIARKSFQDDWSHRHLDKIQLTFPSSHKKNQLLFGKLYNNHTSKIYVDFKVPDKLSGATEEFLKNRYKEFYLNLYLKLEEFIEKNVECDILVKTFFNPEIERQSHNGEWTSNYFELLDNRYILYSCLNIVFEFASTDIEKQIKAFVEGLSYDHNIMEVTVPDDTDVDVYLFQSFVPVPKILQHMRRGEETPSEFQTRFNAYFDDLHYIIFRVRENEDIPDAFKNNVRDSNRFFFGTNDTAVAVNLRKEDGTNVRFLDELKQEEKASWWNSFWQFVWNPKTDAKRFIPLFRLIPIDLLFDGLKIERDLKIDVSTRSEFFFFLSFFSFFFPSHSFCSSFLFLFHFC